MTSRQTDRQTDLWHEVELESHRDDVEADDACDGQVEVLADRDAVQQHPRPGVERPVRYFVTPWSPHHAHIIIIIIIRGLD